LKLAVGHAANGLLNYGYGFLKTYIRRALN
jgi:hypothetical protein